MWMMTVIQKCSQYSEQSKEKPYSVTVELDGVPLEMEVDTGASLSVISEETLKVVRSEVCLPLQICNRRLKNILVMKFLYWVCARLL